MIDLFWVGVSIAVVLCVALLVVILQLQNTRRQQTLLQEEKKQLELRLKNLESKIEFLSTGSKGMGQRLMSAEKKINQAIEKQDEILSNNSDKLFQRQAERVLKQAPKEEEDSALSRSEAKLMALVGGKPSDKS